MVDRYYRKIEDVENDIENSMQTSSILLKLKGYDDDLSKLDINKNNISSNLSKINDNASSISINLGQISTNTSSISSNLEKINTNKNNISSNLGKTNTNVADISDNSGKINTIENDMKITKDIYNETFVMPNKSSSAKYMLIFSKIINSKFITNGIIKINANYNYIYDTKYNFKHTYRFYNNGKQFKNLSLYNNRASNLVNDKFDIQAVNSTEIKFVIYLIIGDEFKNFKLFDSTIQIIHSETNLKSNINEDNIESNLKKINNNSDNLDMNTNNISTNLSKITANTVDISTNLKQVTTNTRDISSNLKQISTNTESISTNSTKIDNFTQYILQSGKDFEKKYTIEKQIFKFNKDKHFYTIFEKEIEYDFTKNSLLFVKNNIYYKYDNLSNDYFRLQHEYNIYDGDNLIHKYLFNKDTYYDENLEPILHTNEDFCICFKKIIKRLN